MLKKIGELPLANRSSFILILLDNKD